MLNKIGILYKNSKVEKLMRSHYLYQMSQYSCCCSKNNIL